MALIWDYDINELKKTPQGRLKILERLINYGPTEPGEVVVQLDSDSYIEPGTIQKLVDYFKNPQVGAVCAHTYVENADQNILTRMQTAHYFVAFRVLKAAESAFSLIFCCSGCSSAYRKSVVLPVID